MCYLYKLIYWLMEVIKFTFGPFQENTYVLAGKNGECVIVDPGCFEVSEQRLLKDTISSRNWNPVFLLNTHCHLDHVAGNRFIHDTYGLLPLIHALDLPILQMQEQSSHLYGLPCDKSPLPLRYFTDGEKISFGNITLQVLLAPGHSPGHVVFFNQDTKTVVSGDVLFQHSIGRTDLPGGNYDTLIASIKNVLFPLGDEVVVYSGHGPETTIGNERKTNPFLR